MTNTDMVFISKQHTKFINNIGQLLMISICYYVYLLKCKPFKSISPDFNSPIMQHVSTLYLSSSEQRCAKYASSDRIS